MARRNGDAAPVKGALLRVKTVADGHDSMTRITLAVRPVDETHGNRADRRMRQASGTFGSQSGKSLATASATRFFPLPFSGLPCNSGVFLLQRVVGANERYSQGLSFLEPNTAFWRKENARHRGTHG